ncbi:hypothetical protein [Zooshikella sp. RANM57]|uniref:hypothetical protein n=1 Tax=Zooshikella sp. RANM57 TaxID=3425863 RepID=UPI003D6F5FD7
MKNMFNAVLTPIVMLPLLFSQESFASGSYASLAEFTDNNDITISYKDDDGITRVYSANKIYMHERGVIKRIDVSKCYSNSESCNNAWQSAKESPMVIIYDSIYDQEGYVDPNDTDLPEGTFRTYCVDSSLDRISNLYDYNEGHDMELMAKHWYFIKPNNGSPVVVQAEDSPRRGESGWGSLENGDTKEWGYKPFGPWVTASCVLQGGHIGYVTKFYETDGEDLASDKIRAFEKAIQKTTGLFLSPGGSLLTNLATHHFLGSIADELTYSSNPDPYTAVSFAATWGALKRLNENNLSIKGKNLTRDPAKEESIQRVNVQESEFSSKFCRYETHGSMHPKTTYYSKLKGYDDLGCNFKHDTVNIGSYPSNTVLINDMTDRGVRRYMTIDTTIKAAKGTYTPNKGFKIILTEE